ncbi:MAG: tyrosine-type recombinase/integrase [bacterium]|nr:tyrosine-type recombinase/integrase [bacterium]
MCVGASAWARRGIQERVTSHPFRHCLATHLFEADTDIHAVRELLGHRDLEATMIHIHVTQSGPLGVRSPADSLSRPGI